VFKVMGHGMLAELGSAPAMARAGDGAPARFWAINP
jgi:hypothetical protein